VIVEISGHDENGLADDTLHGWFSAERTFAVTAEIDLLHGFVVAETADFLFAEFLAHQSQLDHLHAHCLGVEGRGFGELDHLCQAFFG
jgi:hypothetical protein